MGTAGNFIGPKSIPMKEITTYNPEVLSGKVILVTGGTTGIGRATARILAGVGAKVFITGRHQQQLDETVRDTLEEYPDASIKGVTSDLANEEEIDALFAALIKEYGTLDILVNNAGLAAEGITKGTYPEWEYILDTNLLAYLACANAAAKIMKAKGKGHVVNVGSMSAETQDAESTVYVATKAGIRGFSGSLRKELNPHGIRVTLIEPGAVSSDMQPGGGEAHREKIRKMEMLEAEDIALSILYCLSQPERCDVVSLQIRPSKQII